MKVASFVKKIAALNSHIKESHTLYGQATTPIRLDMPISLMMNLFHILFSIGPARIR